MKSLAAAAGCGVLVLGLTACGGGGGGGGAGFPILPVTVPVAAPTTGVTVNGQAAVTDSSGAVALKSSDSVEVTASPDADWTSSAGTAGAVTLSNATITGAKWAATLVNTTTTDQSYTLGAKVKASAGETKNIVFKVAAPPQPYRVFNANGTQLTLALDLDHKTFTFTDSAGARVSTGTVAADASEAGTYIFQDSLTKALPYNNARFRVTADAVVGGYYFPKSVGATAFPYATFVASRKFVTAQADIAGVYNNVGVQNKPGAGTGGADLLTGGTEQVRITTGGAELLRCTTVLVRIDNCAPGSLTHYTVSAPDAAGNWTFTNAADATDKVVLAVARIGSENVLLGAGPDRVTAANSYFSVGIVEPGSWPSGTAYAAGYGGGWGKMQIDGASLMGTGTDFGGTSTTVNYTVMPAVSTQPVGVRQVDRGALPAVMFAVQSPQFYASLYGVNWFGGYLQIGLKP